MMPRPFTKIFFLAGEPIQVPADLSREQVASYNALVQEMNRLGIEVEEMVALSYKTTARPLTASRHRLGRRG